METRFLGNVDVQVAGALFINGTEVPLGILIYAVEYGLKQSIDDAGANPEKGKAGSEARLASLIAGEIPAGGGRRLSEEEKSLRDVVEATLKKAGVKATQAKKAATDPEAAIREATAKKRNFDVVWAAVTAKAMELAAERTKTAVAL